MKSRDRDDRKTGPVNRINLITANKKKERLFDAPVVDDRIHGIVLS